MTQPKRVLVSSRDLFFRGKLTAVLNAAGAEPARAEPYDLAVVELNGAEAEALIRDLVQRGVPVLAFGSHVDANLLRAARELGAQAVPNSQIEAALRAALS